MYYSKYIKYKNKYIQLKGGNKLLDIITNSGFLTNNQNAIISASILREHRNELSLINAQFKEHHVLFPYKYNYKTEEQVKQSFANLINYTQEWSTHKYNINERVTLSLQFQLPDEEPVYLSMKEKGNTYDDIDWITDYFIEESRMKCRRSRKKYSPHDAWYQYDEYLTNALNLLLRNHTDMTYETLREALYKDRFITEECGHEKPSFIKLLFLKLGITSESKIFDGSAGWGDRMIASLAIGCTYLGVDPNTDSQSGFKKMVSVLRPDSNCQVLPEAMPSAKLPTWATDFDLVFLSPPSFDSEVYSEDEGQSIKMFKDKNDWFENFMFKTLDRCWSLLKKGGFLVVQSIIIADLIPHINKYQDGFYCGPISIEFPSRYKPMWIWLKQ